MSLFRERQSDIARWVSSNWKQLTGSIQSKWGELTDDEVQEAKGDREVLVGKIQERYGVARDEAERQVDEWADSAKSMF